MKYFTPSKTFIGERSTQLKPSFYRPIEVCLTTRVTHSAPHRTKPHSTARHGPQRRIAIREVFVDFFGAALSQRAQNFASVLSKGGAGERSEVTVHQLRRYFGLCGTPAIAKVFHRNSYDNVSFDFELLSQNGFQLTHFKRKHPLPLPNTPEHGLPAAYLTTTFALYLFTRNNFQNRRSTFEVLPAPRDNNASAVLYLHHNPYKVFVHESASQLRPLGRRAEISSFVFLVSAARLHATKSHLADQIRNPDHI